GQNRRAAWISQGLEDALKMAREPAENSLPLEAPETLSSRHSAADRATAPDRSIRRQRLAPIQPPPSHRFAAGPSLPRMQGRAFQTPANSLPRKRGRVGVG